MNKEKNTKKNISQAVAASRRENHTEVSGNHAARVQINVYRDLQYIIQKKTEQILLLQLNAILT